MAWALAIISFFTGAGLAWYVLKRPLPLVANEHAQRGSSTHLFDHITGLTVDDAWEDFGDTTFEMLQNMEEKLRSSEIELENELTELIETTVRIHAACLRNAHEAWLAFREHDSRAAQAVFIKGSMGELVYFARSIELTEERIGYIRSLNAELLNQ